MRGFQGFAAEGYFGHIVAELPAAIDDAFAAAGVDEDGVRLEVIDLLDESCRKVHVADGTEYLGPVGNKALATRDGAGVVAEACDVDAEDARCSEDVVLLVDFLAGFYHHVDGDEDVEGRGSEVTVEFLPDSLFAHVSLHCLKFFRPQSAARCKDAGLVGTVHAAVPVRLALCLLVDLVELVLTFRCADEDTPAIAVGQRRTNNLVPELCLDLCVLVEDGSIPVRTAQVVRMVGTDDIDAAALCALITARKLDEEIRLVDADARDDMCVVLQVVPGNELGLVAKWRNVGVHGRAPMILDAFLDEVVDCPDGLAETAMGNDDGEAMALKCWMDGRLPERLWPVRYRDPFLLRCHHRHHLLPM